MDEAAAGDEERRSRVDRTARLVEFLRDLARRRTPPVLDVEREPLVRWLGDLPAGVDVLSDGSPGEVLLRLEKLQGEPPPEVPLGLLGWVRTDDVEDSDLARLPLLGSPDAAGQHEGRDTPSVVTPPDVVTAHAAYEGRWRVWAAQDRTTRVQRDWYARLSEAQHRLSQQDDELELVLAVGLLGWRPPGRETVRSHLLTTPCRLELDAATGSLVVRVGEDAAVRLRDRDLLDGTPGVSEAPAVRERLRSEPPPLLSDAVKDLLLQWQTLALATSRPYAHVWDRLPHAGATPELRLAPALVLRKRDAGPLLAYYDSMLEVLQGADAEAPLGLVQLVEAVSAEQRLAMLEAGGASPASVVGADPLFPLPANEEQRQIVDRLRTDNGVVVQGPPGTGKTHTIANLVSALLAQGQRVLVTSQKAQALSVLRDKLPDAVQELCVSLTEPGRGGATELARSVNAMSGRFTTYDRERHAAQVTALQEAREQARRRVARLREEVRALREAETFRHPEVAAGYGGTAAAIAERLAAGAGRVDWVPVPVPAGDAAPPLPVGEAAELHHLLATSTDGRRARAEQVLPDVAGLPTSAEVRRQLATEQAAAEAARQTRTEVSASLRLLGPEDLSALERLAADARAAQHALGLPEDGTAWPADDWRVGALAEGLAGRDTSILEELWQHGGDARARLDALAGTGLRTVVAPEPTPTGHGSLAGQVAAARGLADYLGSGGQLRKMFRPAVQKAAEQLLAEATVDGLPPTSPELLGAVLAHLEGELTATTLAGAWASVGVPSAIGVPLRARLGALADRHGDLGHVRVVLAARREVAALCARLGARPRLGTPSDWTTFLRDLSAVRLRVEAEEASRATDERAERLRLMSRAPGAPPELATLAHATAARDVDAYEQALAALAAAPAEQVQQRRCDALLARVADAHPLLAASLRSTAHDPRWAERLPGWEEAWAWAVARTFFDRQRQPGRDARLERDLGEAVARVESLTGDLAAAWAWGYCLERMTADQVQALRAYQDATSKIGAGTGKYVHRYQRAARDAMDVAREAVPAWVLPLARVLETIPPGKDSFDVVIVDEASQASLESLFLLWLAPRVIVVGDDKQCAPSEISHGALDPIFARLDAQLSFLPSFLRVALTPRSSLFSLMETRFSSVIRLKEHFRCMPEIIEWSSQQFYGDSPLVPLRQFGADRLPPLRLLHVRDAVTEGANQSLRNRAEAEALADQLARCLADPAYDGKTFGVVVLQGTAQVRLIEAELAARVPPEEWESRRLRVGTPPDFQGDERHVVFLSMVVAERRRAQTRTEMQRRFNVAASRAQDQMWLVHSVPADLLSPDDLRHSLLSYMLDPPAPLAGRRVADVDEHELVEPFESLFEQRVFCRLRDRGYLVTPQWEVNGRRIDLVVTGARGRLAVECDGDHWHGTPEARMADLDREQELRRAGWRFWRVRESEFRFDPDAALEPLWAALAARGIEPGLHDDPADVPAGDRPAGVWQGAVLPRTDEEHLDDLDDLEEVEEFV